MIQWRMAELPDEGLVQQLAKNIGIPPIIAKILVNRDIRTFDDARHFFRPDWDDLLNPFLMCGMEKAVQRIIEAIENDETIFIYGDYDVDGITSVSLMCLYLQDRGAQVIYYIPNRTSEGYGLSQMGIDRGAEAGTKLMITVDCGITAVDEVEYARSLGIDVIISDHHEPKDVLPEAIAILDPKREECSYPFKELAGVGVAFKLIQATSIKLGLDEDSYRHYVDLVALGSAADIVPLVQENRILVSKGLEKINRLDRIGIRELADISGLMGKTIGTGQLIFNMAPRINAVGRLGNAERAVQLLVTNSHIQAREIAQILEKENQNRKSIDEQTFQAAVKLLEMEYVDSQDRAVVLSQEGWHSGVIGIVASRIVEQVYRPTIMIGVEDGIGKGSARSIPNFDVYQAIKKCESYLLGFGGHKYAAGLTIELENIVPFTKKFKSIVNATMKDEWLERKIVADAEISLDDITKKFIRLLNLFAPFGPKNMRPVFLSRNLQVVGDSRIVGRNHLKFKVRQTNQIYDAIGFNLGDLQYRLTPGEKNLDMVYVIDENQWNGQVKVQLRVKDLR